jgi:hypothetical protein
MASRDWYVDLLGLKVEFEVPDRLTVAVQDQFDFTIFFVEESLPCSTPSFCLTFQVDDVQTSFADISGKGIPFSHPPQKDTEPNSAIQTDILSVCGEKFMKAKG